MDLLQGRISKVQSTMDSRVYKTAIIPSKFIKLKVVLKKLRYCAGEAVKQKLGFIQPVSKA